MPSLKTLQTLFCDSLIDDSQHAFLTLIASSLPKERLHIYRINIFHNICNALKITFPRTTKLLGTDNFEKLVTIMICDQQFWPKTGCLDDFGEEWCRFIRSSTFGQEYPNVCDFCDYEWQKNLIFYAPEQDIPMPNVSRYAEEQLLKAHFKFVPACILFSSDYALEHIEQYIDGLAGEECPDQASYLIITKREQQLKTLWLTHDVWIFLYMLYNDYSLSAAIEELESEGIHFNMQAALELIFMEKLAQIHLPELPEAT